MLKNLEDKPWQTKGEVTAKTRPQDSLLEEYLEFDTVSRQAPIQSVETTEQLEKLIKLKTEGPIEGHRKLLENLLTEDFRGPPVGHRLTFEPSLTLFSQRYLILIRVNRNNHQEIDVYLNS